MIAVGQVLSEKYKLTRLVGDGGMGSVYEAEHLLLGTHVAIKVLHPELARRQGLADRFMQEARVSAQIKSPHVVQVHDVDRTPQGEAFLVMELLSGEPLSARLERERKLSETVACDIAVQILEALEAAHGLGAVHRDLKPENVFLTPGADKAFVKVIDFGIAKLRRGANEVQKNLTAAGVMMGTAEYMAPEQAFSAGEVDARADIYSVGVMLYEMLSGTRPVTGEDARVIAVKVERGEGVPLVHAAPGVRPELAGLVQRAIAAHPDLRFSSAAEMRRGIEALLGRRIEGGSAMPAPPAAAAGARATAQIGFGLAPGNAASPAIPAPIAAPRAAGTQMAAPVDAAFRPDLAGTGPAFMGSAPAAYGGALTPPRDGYDYERSAPKKRVSRAWLLLVPLLGGAAAVGTYVIYNNPSSPTPAPLIAPTSTLTSATPTATQTSAPGTATTPATPLTTPPLTNPQTNPVTPHPPGPPGSGPVAPVTPSGVPSFGPPLVLPSGFPFPPASNMPPIQIPSGFPSTFPTMFPPFQPPPAQPNTP